MSLSRDSRTEKKLKAIRRAEFNLRQALERIDWAEDVLYPEIEALKAGRPVLGLEAGAMFDIQVDNASTSHGQAVATPTVRASRPRATNQRARAKSRRSRA